MLIEVTTKYIIFYSLYVYALRLTQTLFESLSSLGTHDVCAMLLLIPSIASPMNQLPSYLDNPFANVL